MNNSLKILLTLVTMVVSYVFFLLLEFPLDAVVGHYLARVEAQTKGAYRVSVSPDMQTSLLFNSTFNNFMVEKNVEGHFQPLFSAPKINVGFSFLSLLSGATNVSFEAKLTKGSVSGGVSLSTRKSVFDLSFKHVFLADVPALAVYLPVAVSGQLDGDVYLSLLDDVKESEGEFKLKIFDFHTDKYTVAAASLDIPPMTLSGSEKPAVIQGALDAGFFKLDELDFPGEDLVLKLKGRVQFVKGGATRSNVNGRFKVSSKVEQALPFIGFLAEQKSPEGDYPLSLTGDLKKPRLSVGTLKLSDMLNAPQ